MQYKVQKTKFKHCEGIHVEKDDALSYDNILVKKRKV